MILRIRHKGLKLLYEKADRSKIRPDLVEKVERVLSMLDRAQTPMDMDLPGFGLHALKGDRDGYWSIIISRNHRLIFRSQAGDMDDVDLVDYH